MVPAAPLARDVGDHISGGDSGEQALHQIGRAPIGPQLVSPGRAGPPASSDTDSTTGIARIQMGNPKNIHCTTHKASASTATPPTSRAAARPRRRRRPRSAPAAPPGSKPPAQHQRRQPAGQHHPEPGQSTRSSTCERLGWSCSTP